jgi:hypothetical protein
MKLIRFLNIQIMVRTFAAIQVQANNSALGLSFNPSRWRRLRHPPQTIFRSLIPSGFSASGQAMLRENSLWRKITSIPFEFPSISPFPHLKNTPSTHFNVGYQTYHIHHIHNHPLTSKKLFIMPSMALIILLILGHHKMFIL